MSRQIVIDLHIPESLEEFRFPRWANMRLQKLLDKQDLGGELSSDEREEAEYLVDLAELLTAIRLRCRRLASAAPKARPR